MKSKEVTKKIKIPHTYVLIFCIIVIMAVLTYIVPAGQYDRVKDEATGRVLVDPNSYQVVEQTPVKPFDIIKAIPAGMGEVSWIIFLIFIIGGSFGIINGTGAIESGIAHSVKKLEGKEKIIIPVTMIIFSIGGATIGLAESTLIFIPIGIALAKSLGFDRITGMAMVNIGATVGFAGGALNPFNVGVAQGIAGLPLFSGMEFRIFGQVIFLIIAIWYTMSYSIKIKKDPTMSLLYGLEDDYKVGSGNEIQEFTTRHKLVLLTMLIGFCFIIYGVLKGWSTSSDLASIFLVMGIVSGFVGGNNSTQVADNFIIGAKSVTYGALVVGLSRGILVVLQQGQIIDTIIHSASGALTIFPVIISAVLMLIVQVVMNFIVNSGSGQAAITMPIMAPLADVVGVSRQTSVLAFQYGDGLSNSFFPTSGILMAGLSIAGIPYDKWFKWVLPLMIELHIVAAGLVVISHLIGLGPF